MNKRDLALIDALKPITDVQQFAREEGATQALMKYVVQTGLPMNLSDMANLKCDFDATLDRTVGYTPEVGGVLTRRVNVKLDMSNRLLHGGVRKAASEGTPMEGAGHSEWALALIQSTKRMMGDIDRMFTIMQAFVGMLALESDVPKCVRIAPRSALDFYVIAGGVGTSEADELSALKRMYDEYTLGVYRAIQVFSTRYTPNDLLKFLESLVLNSSIELDV